MTSTTEGEEPKTDAEPEEPEAAAIPESRALVAARAERMQMQNIAGWGRAMYLSGFFPDVKSEHQAVVKILAGHEYGFPVAASMTGVHIIDGKPVMGAGLMAHAVKASPKYDYRVKEHDDRHCVLVARERFGDDWIESEVEFTFEMAEAAGITGRSRKSPEKPSMWEKYPREMLFARAMSRLVAWYAPDVFAGRVYTPDEIDPEIELTADGEIVDLQVVTVEPNAPPSKPDEPAPESGEAREPVPPRAAPRPERRDRRQAPIEAEDVNSVQAFLVWQDQHYGLNGSEICEALGVDVIGSIGQTYNGKWEDAIAKTIVFGDALKAEWKAASAAQDANREGEDADGPES